MSRDRRRPSSSRTFDCRSQVLRRDLRPRRRWVGVRLRTWRRRSRGQSPNPPVPTQHRPGPPEHELVLAGVVRAEDQVQSRCQDDVHARGCAAAVTLLLADHRSWGRHVSRVDVGPPHRCLLPGGPGPRGSEALRPSPSRRSDSRPNISTVQQQRRRGDPLARMICTSSDPRRQQFLASSSDTTPLDSRPGSTPEHVQRGTRAGLSATRSGVQIADLGSTQRLQASAGTAGPSRDHPARMGRHVPPHRGRTTWRSLGQQRLARRHPRGGIPVAVPLRASSRGFTTCCDRLCEVAVP